jgi:dipeptidyl-peptidase-4
MLNSRIRATLVVAFLSAAPLVAQTTELSVATIFGDGEFASDLIEAKWTPDPMYFTVLEENGDLADLYRVDARSGDRQLLLRGTDLVPRGESTPIAIEEYEFSSDGSKLLIFTNSVRVWRSNTKGEYYVWDFNRRRLIAVGEREGLQMFAKFSPDGRYVGFVRDNNIFVTEIRNGRERQLTFDGDENIINGTTDWVYEEELGLQDAFRFSPDSRKIAFWRLDQTVIKPFYMIDQLSLYPELMPVRYPKAGEANSEVRIGVVEISSRDATWIDLGEETDIYVPRMDFAGSSDEVWFTRLNRHQNRLDLMLADVRTGESRIVTTETDDAWVENSMPLWIDNGVQFLLESERDGYNQVYRYDRSGTLINRVTPGEWDVLDVYGVDEQHDVLYFSGTGDGRAKRPLYRVSLDGAGFERVSSGSGSHDVDFNVDYSMYVDEYSTIGLPPTKTLHESDGATVRTLSDNQQLISRIQALAAAVPEFIRIPVRGGLELDGYIIRPPDFDVGKLYPVLMYVYGGPGSQRVRDSWGGDRYLWHQSLAQLGYLVVSVDNRGTGARGRDFKKQTYLKLGQYETEDQIAAARYLGSLPFVDNSRIGIWGWSYGGYMSLMSMFQGEGVFKAAISVAPVTDWRLYDTIYTERYMRTPRENPAGYRDGAPLNHAYKLSGDLLVVHGTGDDNVHAQNTIQLIQQLEDAGMQFDMRLYPNKTHSIAGAVTRVNLYSLFTRWLQENL